MRILHVSASARFGGGPEHIRLLVVHRASDVECVVAASPDEPYAQRFAELVAFRPLALRSLSPLVTRALARVAREERIDLVHAHGRGAALHARLAARLCGLPCVYTFHGMHVGRNVGRLDGILRLRDRIYLAGERALAGLVARFVAVSESEAEQIAARGIAPREHVTVIVNAIDARFFAAPPAGPCGAGEPWRLLSVARTSPEKGLDRVPEVVRALDARGVLFEWHVYGTGPEQASSRDPRVCWHGEQPVGPELYAAHHVLVALSRREGLPMTPLEAGAVGLPCVATRVAGNRDALALLGTPELCVPLGEIGDAIDSLREPARWRAASETVRARARACADPARMAREVEAVYRQLLG